VLEYLRTIGLPVVVIDTHCSPDDARLAGVRLVQGDCRRREVLEDAGAASARAVLILTSDDLVNISTALMVRHLHPEVRVVLRMFNQNLIPRLGKAVHNIFALSTSTLAAPVLAVTALTGQGLGTFHVEGPAPARPSPHGRQAAPVRNEPQPNEVLARRQVAEVTVGPGQALRGQTVGLAAARHDAFVVCHTPEHGAPRFLHEVDPDARLEAGDRLVVCGDPRRLAPLLGAGGPEADAPVRWPGWVRRSARVAWRTLHEVDLPVKICTTVLVVVVVASTVVFRLTQENQTWAGALYRTISVMATAADMRMTDTQPAGLKIFASALRISGAALMAAFTAIVTSFLVRARLRGALEVRRVPDGGHVVICGLGNVGFRVVEELLGYGERVVVLELNKDGRFVSTARRLGAAVIHGDAAVREVLRQAHAATARAVIAATSNELVNLEIALLVRDLNPSQRVVVRLSDPYLAQTLREAANIRLALSVPALVAPAFAAALFGDSVLSVFFLADRLLLVLDLLVQPQDTHLVDQSVRAVAVDYNLLPVVVLSPEGAQGQQLLNARLAPGSRLVAVLGLPDLDRFVRRQRVPADWAVDVTGFTLPARGWVALLLRHQRGLSAEAAERELEQLPVCAGNNLTRGQAEDLLARMERERVAGQLRRQGAAAPS
jgi:Trk K+ transport system NAD-binding subunit